MHESLASPGKFEYKIFMVNKQRPSSVRTGIQSREVDLLFVILILIFGLFVRVFPVAKAPFPLVDGGMFYSMILDLQRTGFSLPASVSYNQFQIPFAYPPFAIYLTAAINSLTGIPLLHLIQWLPVIINCLTLGVIFLFARRYWKNRTDALLTTLIFSLTPNSYWWQIVGGGLTRSLGAGFTFLFAYFAFRIFHDEDTSIFALTGAILTGALAVLSHPEWALQACFTGLLFTLFWGRKKHIIVRAAIIPAAVLALTAVWWLTVLQRYGVNVFWTASTATENRLLFFMPFFSMQFTGEYTAFIAFFAMIGMFIALVKKQYFPLAWGMGCLLVDPRGGIPCSILPFSILASLSITDLMAPFFLRSRKRETDPWWNFLDSTMGKIFLGVFVILCLSHAYEVSSTLSVQHLSQNERKAMQWVKQNSQANEKYLVLGVEENPAHSALTEWFPALTGHQSITTIQGQEWLGNYHQAEGIFSAYQQCFSEDLACIQALNNQYNLEEDCIYLSLARSTVNPDMHVLSIALTSSSEYELVFSSEDQTIFCRIDRLVSER